MKIREAKIGDLAALMEYAIAQKNRTVYASIEESRAMVAYQFRRSMQSATENCILIDDDGTLRGFILLSAMPYWWTDPRTGARFVTDLSFFSSVRGGGVALLKKAIEWAKTVPRVKEITFQHSSGLHVGSIDVVYKAAGLSRLGGCWWKDLRTES